MEIYGPLSPAQEMHNAHKARMARIKLAIDRREAQIAADIAADDARESKAQVVILEALLAEEILTVEPWFHVSEPLLTLVPTEPRIPKIDEIQRKTAEHYGVKRIDLLSSRRTANIVRPRQVAMYLAKTMTLRSLPEIGRRFGGRDHTTVLHAVRKMTALVAMDVDLAATVETIRAEIAA